MAEPWERREDESEQAFAAFSAYRSQEPGRRSIRRALIEAKGTDAISGNLRRWETWSSGHEWQRRVRAWDAEVDRERQRVELKAIAEMREAHIRQGRALQAVGLEGLSRYQRDLERDPEKRIAPGLAQQLIQTGTQIERLSRGEPTEILNSLADRRVVEIVWTDEEPDEADVDEGDWDELPDGSDAPDASGAAEDPEQ